MGGLLASNLLMRACGAVNQAATSRLQGVSLSTEEKELCLSTVAEIGNIARTKGRFIRGHNPSVNPTFMASSAKRYKISSDTASGAIEDGMANLEPLMCTEQGYEKSSDDASQAAQLFGLGIAKEDIAPSTI